MPNSRYPCSDSSYSQKMNFATCMRLLSYYTLLMQSQIEEVNSAPSKSILQQSYLVYSHKMHSSFLQFDFYRLAYPLLKGILSLAANLQIEYMELADELLRNWWILWREFCTNVPQKHNIILIIFRLSQLDYSRVLDVQEYGDYSNTIGSFCEILGTEVLNSFGFFNEYSPTSSFYTTQLYRISLNFLEYSDRHNFWTSELNGNRY